MLDPLGPAHHRRAGPLSPARRAPKRQIIPETGSPLPVSPSSTRIEYRTGLNIGNRVRLLNAEIVRRRPISATPIWSRFDGAKRFWTWKARMENSGCAFPSLRRWTGFIVTVGLGLCIAGCERKPPPTPALMPAHGNSILSSETGQSNAPILSKSKSATNPDLPHADTSSSAVHLDGKGWCAGAGRFKYELREVYSETNSGRALLKSGDVIPPAVKAYDGVRVSITGFVLPLRIRSPRVTGFLLLRDQGACCFGPQAQINHFIPVKFPSGLSHEGASPWTVTGILRVGEMSVQAYLTGICHLDAESVKASATP
jgi:hypothetical protein